MSVLATAAKATAGAVAAGYLMDKQFGFSHEWPILRGGMVARKKFQQCEATQDCSIYNRFEEQVLARPYEVALVFEGVSHTWKDMELVSSKIAHWLLSKGIQPGDRVALLMNNSAMFMHVFLAVLKIAGVTAFINNQISGPILIHSLKVADAKMLIFDYELLPTVQESVQEIKELGYSMYTITPKEQVLGHHFVMSTTPTQQQQQHSTEGQAMPSVVLPDFFGFIDYKDLSSKTIPREYRKHIKMDDPAALIYTSGTTGFPKAAIMDHGRCTLAPRTFGTIAGIKNGDHVYITLPLYHAAGAMIGVAQSWATGSTIVLARKFSVKRFWRDCVDYNVTHIQYIGELCRYLLNAPPGPLDRVHNVKVAFGNGLRPDIWKKFQDRFGVQTIFEYYAMSEGPGALLNLSRNGKGLGAVGFRGPLIRRMQPGLRIVRADIDSEQLIRDPKTGFCIECSNGDIGELLALADNKTYNSRYTGYFNQPKVSKAKLVQNVFQKGDQWMRTGDLLYKDSKGFYYFADRAGDTYRWKSENVSTTEIEATLGRLDEVAGCTVYGVQVQGQDGRAGMATLVLKDGIVSRVVVGVSEKSGEEKVEYHVDEHKLAQFIHKLGEHSAKYMPGYAIPRFIRISEQELETTGTFKNRKVDLRKEGFDLDKVRDRMYWWTPEGRYLPFGVAENRMIVEGRARL
ncbi:hypothetical protein DFQ27_008741 [Actinomortierella ambigua]|uniref:Uncharacterized protein n=1 Tax=Actinomortierella ambigua TaxID=1343610 RepID=A0A9P6UBD9_9FUNG|nr:hypothetical protein DFQ27_008741 [Actinomortierella ambigua]